MLLVGCYVVVLDGEYLDRSRARQAAGTHDNNGALEIMEVSLSFMINYEGVAGGNCAN